MIKLRFIFLPIIIWLVKFFFAFYWILHTHTHREIHSKYKFRVTVKLSCAQFSMSFFNASFEMMQKIPKKKKLQIYSLYFASFFPWRRKNCKLFGTNASKNSFKKWICTEVLNVDFTRIIQRDVEEIFYGPQNLWLRLLWFLLREEVHIEKRLVQSLSPIFANFIDD